MQEVFLMNAQQKSGPAARQLQDIKRIARLIATGADRSMIQLEWGRMVVGAVTSGTAFDVDLIVQQII
jgi:hypothetical protein